MKTLLSLLLASSLLVSAFAAPAENISARGWLESYYLNPQPERLPHAMLALSREGYFERPGHIPIAVGFFATVFEKNPQRVDAWLIQLNALPMKHHRLVAAALWQSGHPLGAELLHALGEHSPLRAEVQRLAALPARSVSDTAVLSPASMNLQWGAFLATGDERHILNVFDAIGIGQPGLDTAARVALARNAAAHPRVLEICRTQLERQPGEVRDVLRAALNGTATAPRI